MPNQRRMTADELDALAEELLRIAAAGGDAQALAAHLARHDLPLRSFWERLLAGDYRDFARARDAASARGITLAQRYVAISLEAAFAPGEDAAASTATLRAAAARAFHEGDGGAAILERGAEFLILAPAQRDVDAGNARTAAELLPRTLAKAAPQLRFCGGIGLPAPASEIRVSAEQAETARTIGTRAYGIGRTIAYEDVAAYVLLLEGADSARLAAFASDVLEPLRAYDEKHQTELERTLRLYFSVGQNVKTAAAELHVHRQTVFYRLRQVGDICSRSLDDAHDQLTLRMALAIDALQR